MKKFVGLSFLLAVIAATFIACGGGSTSSTSSQSGPVFVTGEDAPLASVVGFNVTVNSITLNGQTSAQVLSTPATVDFARLLGLRSPLAFNTVPAGTYTGATFSLANPVISYVDMSTNPPTESTINGTFGSAASSTTSVAVNFPTPMTVTSSGLAGLRMEVNIAQSLAVDGNGQVTGTVNPVIYAWAVQATDTPITDLVGGLSSVDTTNSSFVLQGPYGHQITIFVNDTTTFNGGWSLNNLAAPAFIAVIGNYQPDGSLIASEVEVITTAQAFISGRVLAVTTNSSGVAQQLTMWVGETGPVLSTIPVDSIYTVDVSNVSQYDICFFDNALTQVAFSNSSVIVGQRLFIGGTYSNNVFTPQMISLRFQGVYGNLVSGSVSIVSGNLGTFQLQNNALIGYSLGGAPLNVDTGNLTTFINTSGLSQLQTSGSIPLVARGIIFVSPITSTPVMWSDLVVDPPAAQ